MNVISKPLSIADLVENTDIEWIEQDGKRFEKGSREYEQKKHDLIQRYEIYMWDSGIFGRVPILKVAPLK